MRHSYRQIRAGMRASRTTVWLRQNLVLIIIFAVIAFLVTGCGSRETHSSLPIKSPVPGANYKKSEGVILTDEMRSFLHVEISELVERKLSNRIQFTVQLFGENHLSSPGSENHSECEVRGSVFLPAATAKSIKPGQRVQLNNATNTCQNGRIVSLSSEWAANEVEAVIGMPHFASAQPGDFIEAFLSLPEGESVVAVPLTALLHTAEGAFVYAVNGSAYYPTAVQTGREADGFIEIKDGLLAGDQVVTRGVAELWLIQLRATKGGGGCSD